MCRSNSLETLTTANAKHEIEDKGAKAKRVCHLVIGMR